ncbi:hypothetical protein ACFVWR_18355 [Leifsonia sp. NPDC058292]|uniref:hypothetical protein n=1 Tax=Leifsonia sp. NPDC058292 TaxID=3346428 RepID=UPI0036D9B3BA
MTSLGEITVTDLNSWQARGLRILCELQEGGLKAGRYPLDWAVNASGALRGQVHRYDPKQTDEDRRAVFDEWVRVLAGTAPREEERWSGGTSLVSLFKVPTASGEVRGSIVVDFDELVEE